ncbi:MAG: hypothetical protein K0R82_2666 [Flavipsychrobacter sp.]|nr:hypothetical protein [Flavipsychrobacter sp.]
MKTFYPLLIALLGLATNSYAQPAKELFEQGMDKAKKEDFAGALAMFDSSIRLKPDVSITRFYRAITLNIVDEPKRAIADLDTTLILDPGFYKAYLHRGIANRELTEYDAALADFSKAIAAQPDYAEAYFERGRLHQLLSKKAEGCADFKKSMELGYEQAEHRVKQCEDPKLSEEVHPILYLKEVAKSKKYGFSEKDPIKVGNGPDGGPGNQRRYIQLLRDKQNRPVTARRLGSCCSYESKGSPLGLGMLDRYEISFRDEKGNEKTEIIYISFYDYEEPKILHGFQTISK